MINPGAIHSTRRHDFALAFAPGRSILGAAFARVGLWTSPPASLPTSRIDPTSSASARHNQVITKNVIYISGAEGMSDLASLMACASGREVGSEPHCRSGAAFAGRCPPHPPMTARSIQRFGAICWYEDASVLFRQRGYGSR